MALKKMVEDVPTCVPELFTSEQNHPCLRPPCSSDLALSHFSLFPGLKSELRNNIFDSSKAVLKKVEMVLRNMVEDVPKCVPVLVETLSNFY
ncbi:hypothetical protein AVEN_182794-1 [Araneus ventricosus]|uniref:Uncharacterized protein n=1 Tax=Araneus ventricosus TaxID=182803 RepID=A0A4Y2HRJ3_ARAVE|nr:hypothetical protein AVEN_182794-1 [Araneus ventricosus]